MLGLFSAVNGENMVCKLKRVQITLFQSASLLILNDSCECSNKLFLVVCIRIRRLWFKSDEMCHIDTPSVFVQFIWIFRVSSFLEMCSCVG